MKKKERIRFFGAVLGFLAAVSAGVLILCLVLKRDSFSIARDNLPGMAYAGMANAAMNAHYIGLLNLPSARSGDENLALLKRTASLAQQDEDFLARYQTSVFDAQDQANFDRAMRAHRAYVAAQKEFIASWRAHPEAAAGIFKAKVTPAFNDCAALGDVLFKYNMNRGQVRSDGLLAMSHTTPVVLALFGFLLFATGVLAGIRISTDWRPREAGLEPMAAEA